MRRWDLHMFRTVVREGGIVRAARRLHRVPSNVTTRIQQLEASIGVQLFTRERHRRWCLVKPRTDARVCRPDAAALRRSEEKPSRASRPPACCASARSINTTASRLPAILAAYHKAYPDVRVELITGTNDALTAAVHRPARGSRIRRGSASGQGVRRPASVPRTAGDHLGCPSPAHRRPPDIDGDSVIAFPNGCYYRRVLQRWLGANGGCRRLVLELGSDHAIVACVASGTGIALAHSCSRPRNRAARCRNSVRAAQSAQRCRHAARRACVLEQAPALTALRDLLARQRGTTTRPSSRIPAR